MYQVRAWDYAADLDKRDFCDTMTTHTLVVATAAVETRVGIPCDALDLSPGRFVNLGTI